MVADKPVYLQVRCTQEEKEEFFKVCKDLCINPSEWIRRQVADFIRDQQKK